MGNDLYGISPILAPLPIDPELVLPIRKLELGIALVVSIRIAAEIPA